MLFHARESDRRVAGSRVLSCAAAVLLAVLLLGPSPVSVSQEAPETAGGEEGGRGAAAFVAREKGRMALADEGYATAALFFREYRDATRQREPYFADATILLCKALLLAGDTDGAAQALDFHAQRTKDLTDRYYRDGLVYSRASLHLARRQFEQAIAVAEGLTATQVAPEFRKLGFQLLGDAYIESAKWREAEDILTRLIEIAPESDEGLRARFALLRVYLATNRPGQASTMMEEITRKHDNVSPVELDRYRVLLFLVNGKTEEAYALYMSISAKRPAGANVEWWQTVSRLATALQGAGANEQALIVLDHARGLAPTEDDRIKVILRIAETQMALGKTGLAMDTLEDFRTRYPDRKEAVPALLKLAEMLREAKNHNTAAMYFAMVMEHPEAEAGFRYRACISLGWTLRDSGQINRAAETFARGEALGQTPDQKAEALLLAGDAAFETGDFPVAADHYRRIAENYSGASLAEAARFRQARALAKAKLYDDACATFSVFLRDFPGSRYVQEATLEYGIALKNAADNPGDYSRAMEILRGYGATYPESVGTPRALLEASEAATGAERIQDAVAILTTLIEKYPSSDLIPRALYERARVHFYRTNYEQAVADSKAFLAKYGKLPMATDILVWLGDHYANQGDWATSRTYFRQLARDHAQSPQTPDALYEAARCSYELGEYDSSSLLLEALGRLEDPKPTDEVKAKGMLLEGDVLAKLGRYQDALAKFAGARRAAGDTELGWASLGRQGEMYYALAGDDEANLAQAMACFRSLIDARTVSPGLREAAKYRLAKCHRMKGENEEAVKICLDILYEYELDFRNGKVRAWFYAARSGYDAAHMLEVAGEMSDLRLAARTYERLARLGIPTAKEAARRAEEIRRTNGMDE